MEVRPPSQDKGKTIKVYDILPPPPKPDLQYGNVHIMRKKTKLRHQLMSTKARVPNQTGYLPIGQYPNQLGGEGQGMVWPMQERGMEYQRLDRLAPEPVPVPAPAPVILERNQVI